MNLAHLMLLGQSERGANLFQLAERATRKTGTPFPLRLQFRALTMQMLANGAHAYGCLCLLGLSVDFSVFICCDICSGCKVVVWFV